MHKSVQCLLSLVTEAEGGITSLWSHLPMFLNIRATLILEKV
jgi:hypothetical protein